MIADSRDEDDEDSFDRPELPRELPFEQELAAIPPEAMRALQEEFLAGLYEPEDEGKVSHADMVAEATQRTREFLLACHDEKWRRQKSSPCYEVIAKTPLADIARRTLSFMCNGSVSQDKACALVITELEAQDYARLEMALGGTYEEGIGKFRLSRQAHAHLEQRARMPKWEWQRDERGKLRPAQFDPALKALFPLPGCRGKRAQAERLKRFSSFLIGVIRDERSGWDEQQLLSQAEKRLDFGKSAVGRRDPLFCG